MDPAAPEQDRCRELEVDQLIRGSVLHFTWSGLARLPRREYRG